MDYGLSHAAPLHQHSAVRAASDQWPSEGSAEQGLKQSSEEAPESTSPEANGTYSEQEQQQQQQQQQWPWADEEPQAENDSDYDDAPAGAPKQPSSSGSGYDTDLSLPSHGRWAQPVCSQGCDKAALHGRQAEREESR